MFDVNHAFMHFAELVILQGFVTSPPILPVRFAIFCSLYIELTSTSSCMLTFGNIILWTCLLKKWFTALTLCLDRKDKILLHFWRPAQKHQSWVMDEFCLLFQILCSIPFYLFISYPFFSLSEYWSFYLS